MAESDTPSNTSSPAESDANLQSALPRLPLFPLPNVVLFPHALLPLHIFEERYRAMVRDILSGTRFIAVSLAACAANTISNSQFRIEPLWPAAMLRRFALLLIAALLLVPAAAQARVVLAFHSFNGSYFGGRYPHTFIVLEGTLEAGGQAVRENYGFSTSASAIAALSGNQPGIIQVEKDKYLTSTNRHFTVSISDAQYHAILAEVNAWKDGPGQKRYSLDSRNCIHFVARIAAMVGITAPVPESMVRRPKQWLNHVTGLNPQLGARPIR